MGYEARGTGIEAHYVFQKHTGFKHHITIDVAFIIVAGSDDFEFLPYSELNTVN